MNQTVDNFLLARDKFVPEMNLGQPGVSRPLPKKQRKNTNI